MCTLAWNEEFQLATAYISNPISVRIRFLASWRTFPDAREQIVYHRSSDPPSRGATMARMNLREDILPSNFARDESTSISKPSLSEQSVNGKESINEMEI